ncbi:MAG: alpha/beta hydrolase [Bacteroidales bacterium]|nr:alpha/beta hydrolase [Bacteroidales bacterium]
MTKRLVLTAALCAAMLTSCRSARTARVQAAATEPDTVFTITLLGDECTFADHAVYGFYVPSTAEQIRGIMVFQHGCSQEEWGISRNSDVQYQAFARKWDLAILETNIFGLCDVWAFPERGSYAAMLLALNKAAFQCNRRELVSAPWLVWGHSGGGYWVLEMLHKHPEKLIAAICYSAAWDPRWDYLPVAYDVPILFRHAGPGEGADGIPATARHSFADLRAGGSPASIAYTKGQTHNHSYMRTITVPFWEAALKQRLAPDGSLRPLDPGKTFLGDTVTFQIFPEAGYEGDKSALCRLPDEASARAWSQFASEGRCTDTTPPDAPFLIKVKADGEDLIVTWRAEADLESGIGNFNIYKDGALAGRVPESGLYQTFDVNGDNAIPATPAPMEFRLPGAASQRAAIQVETVNRDGLASPKVEFLYQPYIL